jgi:hypothetical protein
MAVWRVLSPHTHCYNLTQLNKGHCKGRCWTWPLVRICPRTVKQRYFAAPGWRVQVLPLATNYTQDSRGMKYGSNRYDSNRYDSNRYDMI